MSAALSNLDQNRWYHISNADNAVQRLTGTFLVFDNHTTGAVFNQNIQPSSPEQIWQFYPVNDTGGGGAYILRTQAGGRTGFLSTYYDANSTWIGQTVPRLVNSSAVAEGDREPGRSSIFWSAEFFADGFVGLSNRANGSEWRLRMKPDGLAVMDRDRTGPPGQRFRITPAGLIDDERFSTVVLPTVRSEPTTSSEPTVSGTSGPEPVSSGGLSAGAQAGVGVGVGIAALFAIIMGVWFLLRRRKQHKQLERSGVPPYDAYEQGGPMRYEKTAPLQEASTESEYVELQGGRNQIVNELPAGRMKEAKSINDKPVELPVGGYK